MLVNATLTNPKPVIHLEYDNSFYHNRPTYVRPRNPEGINGFITVWQDANENAELRAGYTLTDYGLFYMTNAGNWVFLFLNGTKVFAGGQRRGIPWDKVGLVDKDQLSVWHYDDTRFPTLHPMDVLDEGTHAKFVKDTLKIARLKVTTDPVINKKLVAIALMLTPHSMKDLSGYKLARKLAYLKVDDDTINLVLRHKK